MSDDDEIHNLMLDHLKAIRNEQTDFRREITHELHSLSERLSALETHMSGIFKSITNIGGDVEKLKFDMRKVNTRLQLSADDDHPA